MIQKKKYKLIQAQSADNFDALAKAATESGQDAFLLLCVDYAKRGDAVCASGLLYEYCQYVERRKQVPVVVLDYLCDAFRQHLRNRKPIDKALNLARKPSRPQGKTKKNPALVVAAFYWLTKERGRNRNDAIGDAARVFGISERAIERYLKSAKLTKAHYVSGAKSLLTANGLLAKLEQEIKNAS